MNLNLFQKNISKNISQFNEEPLTDIGLLTLNEQGETCSYIQKDSCPLIKDGGACVGYTLKSRGELLDKEVWDIDEGDTVWKCVDAE